MFAVSLRPLLKRFLVFILISFTPVLFTECTVPDINKPLADYRLRVLQEFRLSQLPNGILAACIRNTRATQYGFSVGVRGGSFQDTEDIPGIAHFTEHMVFLGSRNYPDETAYDTFISSHGGSNNAYTQDEATIFLNQVAAEGFDEALDRFVDLLTDPLFSNSSIYKEAHAVDAEHQKNMPNDVAYDERVMFTVRSQAKGVLSHFATGNLQTLLTDPLKRGTNMTQALRNFHRQNYCGSNMVVTTISNSTLDEQESLVRDKFGKIASTNGGECPQNIAPKLFPYDMSNTGYKIQMKAFGEPSLWVLFNLPGLQTSYKKQPLTYLTYLFDYSGPFSLRSRLRSQGLARKIESVEDKTSLSTLFGVKLLLTPQGVRNTTRVLDEVFSYVNMLREKGANEAVLTSLQQFAVVEFQNSQPSGSAMDDAARISENLLYYEPFDVISGDFLVTDKDPQFIGNLIQKLRPENSVIVITKGDLPLEKASLLYQEKFYEVVYSMKKFSATQISYWESMKADRAHPPQLLHIPSANELSLKNVTAGEHPILVEHSVGTRIWWQGQKDFLLPKISMTFASKIGSKYGNPLTSAQGELLARIVREELVEPTAAISSCGTSYAVDFTETGLSLSFVGYSVGQLRVLMDIVGSKLRQIFQGDYTNEAELIRKKQQLLEDLMNDDSELAFEHAARKATILSTSNTYDKSELRKVLELPEFDEQFWRSTGVFQKAFTEIFSMGNIGKNETLELAQGFLKKAFFRELNRAKAMTSKSLKVSSPTVLTERNPITKDKDNCAVLEYSFGIPTIENRVIIQMIAEMLNRRMYDELRTKEQLGYIVGVSAFMQYSNQKLRVVLEGTSVQATEQMRRIKKVISEFNKSLANMPQNEIDEWHRSMYSAVTRPDANFEEVFERLWGPIAKEDYCFNMLELEARFLESALITPRQLQQVSSKLFNRSGRTEILMNAPRGSNLNVLNETNATTLIPETKASLELSSIRKNFMPWPRMTICHLENSVSSRAIQKHFM